jgi:hypothetical protein
MSSVLLVSEPPQVSLLGQLVERLGQDVGRPEAREAIVPLIDRLEQSVEEPLPPVVMPRQELMQALVAMIKELVLDEEALDVATAREVVRDRVVELMSRIVQDMTGADCVLVRRLHTDGRAELIGRPFFHGQEIGRPPRMKTLRVGVSSRLLFARPDCRPIVVADLDDIGADAELRAAHRANLDSWAIDSPEHRFIASIRGEICIPLVVKGRALAGVVAVRWRPYEPGRAREIEHVLGYWQKILTYFYCYALPIEEHNRTHARISEVTRSLPRVVAAMSDTESLGKVATLLTSDQGLGWHRAFLYLFRDGYPSDAVCPVALGGLGDPSWAEKQAELTTKYSKLDEYLALVEGTAFGRSDPLCLLAREEPEALTIPVDHLLRHEGLVHAFSGDPEPGEKFPRGDALVTLAPRDPWLVGLPALARAFDDAAAECEHYVLPLIRHRSFEPLGFLIVDNPYARAVESCPDLTLTQLVVQLVAVLLAGRGLGIEGWYQDHLDRMADLCYAGEVLRRYDNDPGFRAKYRVEARPRSVARPRRDRDLPR